GCAVAGRQRQNAVQMVGQDHARGQRERVALAARSKRELEHLGVVGERRRALVCERSGEEMLGGCEAYALHRPHCGTAQRGAGSDVRTMETAYRKRSGFAYGDGGVLAMPSAFRISIGSGNTMVELLSPAMLPSVCR